MKNLVILLNLFFLFMYCACNKPETKIFSNQSSIEFDSNVVSQSYPNYKNVKGQLLYLPIYSNVPYNVDTIKYLTDMSAFVAIHNTDLKNKVKIIKALYFDTNGKLVHDFLKDDVKEINPLATVDFYVPYEDKSGTGANFLIEWKSDTLVNEPLIESVTNKLVSNQSAAIVSQGKIIYEIK